MNKKYLAALFYGILVIATIVGAAYLAKAAWDRGERLNYHASVTELARCSGLDPITQEPLPPNVPLAAGVTDLQFCGRVDGEGKIPLSFFLRREGYAIAVDSQELSFHPGRFVASFTTPQPGFAAGKLSLVVQEARQQLAAIDFVIE